MKSHAFIWICIPFAVLGCQHDSDSPQKVAPLLNAMPPQSVVTGKTLTILLCNDTRSANIVLTTDGTVGPNKNPYAELTPATFDASQGEFAWTPTDTEAGNYSVQFTATDETSAPVSVYQTVNITVYTPAQFGVRLFGEHCATCHGVNATGLSAKSVLLKTRDDIAHALDTITEMASLNNALTDEEIDWIGLGLASLRTHLAEHLGLDLTTTCDSCHDGEKASGKINVHIPTSSDCGMCHLPTAWSPTYFDHSSTSAACDSCHYSTSNRSSKPTTHISSTSVCSACHNTETWKPVISVDHAEVIGACDSCHNDQTATGKTTTHISTTLNCALCHLVSAWRPPYTDHTKLGDLPCVACHESKTAPI